MGQRFSKRRRSNYTRDDQCAGPEHSVPISAADNLRATVQGIADSTLGQQAVSVDYASDTAVLSCAAAGGTACLFGGKDQVIREYDYSSGAAVNSWRGHSRDVTKVIWCLPMACAFSASRDTTAKMWRRGSPHAVATFSNHDLVVTGLALDPYSGTSSRYLCTGSRDNKICMWDIESTKVINEKKIAQNLVTHMCWKDGLLAQTSEDKQLRLWDPKSLEVTRTFARKQQILLSCDILAPLVITSSHGINGTGCEVTLWDVRGTSSLPVHEFKGHTESVATCRFMPQLYGRHDLFASVASDRLVKVWSHTSPGLVCELQAVGTGPLTDVAMNEDDTRLCVSTFEKGVIFLSCIETQGSLRLVY